MIGWQGSVYCLLIWYLNAIFISWVTNDNCQKLDEFTLTKGISLFGVNCKNYDSIGVTCSVSSITLQT